MGSLFMKSGRLIHEGLSSGPTLDEAHRIVLEKLLIEIWRCRVNKHLLGFLLIIELAD